MQISNKHGSIWSREELILCFYLYCQIPFSKTNKSNPEVKNLAKVLDRTVGSVVRKLGNFGAIDERLRAYNIIGLTNYSKLDKEIFEEFVNNWGLLVEESQKIISEVKRDEDYQQPEDFINNTIDANIILIPSLNNLPTEKKAVVNIRLQQAFFRRSVLSNYDNKCCISGLDIPELLVASHIIPWAKNENTRIDPRNGIALSAIHDRAFDKGLITITPDYKVLLSKRVLKSSSKLLKSILTDFDGKVISFSVKFSPKIEYLKWHNDNIFKD